MVKRRLNRIFKGLQEKVFAPMEDPKMPLAEHLEELRVRLTRAVPSTSRSKLWTGYAFPFRTRSSL